VVEDHMVALGKRHVDRGIIAKRGQDLMRSGKGIVTSVQEFKDHLSEKHTLEMERALGVRR